MKHLFLVHSPITYLVTISLINELRIPKENAVIIFFEFDEIKVGELYTSASLSKFHTRKTSIKRIYNYFRYFNIINRVDRTVDDVIGNEKFIAYVPVLIFAGKALITHTNCVSFNFIEEGLAHYYKEETIESLARPYSRNPWRSSNLKSLKTILNDVYLVLRGYNFKLQALPFSYSCYNSFRNVKFFGLSEDAFPLVDSRKKVIVPFEKKILML